MAGRDAGDLAPLLAHPRRGAFDLWVDLLSPTCRDAVALLGLDGASRAGRPWCFHGTLPVRLRHLPDDHLHPHAGLAARAVEVVRAWAVRQRSQSLPLDYEAPWRFAIAVLQDQDAVARFGLPQLVALADHEGEWVGDWVAEFAGHPAVREQVAADAAAARDLGVRIPPAYLVGTQLVRGDDLADVTARVEGLLVDRLKRG